MAAQPAIFVLDQGSLDLGCHVAERLDGEVFALAKRVRGGDTSVDDLPAAIRSAYADGRPIVAVMAVGALVRILAPVLADKMDEPPVVALAADASSVVPVLGGHHGANRIARELADLVGAHPSITTAGDLRLGLALDEPPAGWTLAAGDVKEVAARLIAGERAQVDPSLSWVAALKASEVQGSSVRLTVSEQAHPQTDVGELVYRPRNYVLGVGCERGASPDEVIALAREVLREADVAPSSLAAVVSIDLKADEVAIHALAAELGVPARFFDAARLEAEANRLKNPSDIVFAEVGCHGVAEGAALAAVGAEGELVVPKHKSVRATAALGRADTPVDPQSIGRDRGSLAIVGLGPGSLEWRSPEASRAVREADHLVGYSLYLDLCGTLRPAQTRHDYPLGGEEDRVRHALELAGSGERVALVCSGDPGIYAMAALGFELIDRGDVSDGARRAAITVVPGISALQGAAARAGAPLGHDFCAISLSDLLTPWEVIAARIEGAAAGDFVIAFYNPVSRRRRTQLAHARDVLLRHRPSDTPVILATNLGRDGERVRQVTLAQLDVDEVDMLTTVVVGASTTRAIARGDGGAWIYTPRGYAAKVGSRIIDMAGAAE